MADSPWIVDVDETNFEEEVLVRSQEALVLVDFWAEWCGPCKRLGPLLEAEVARRGGAVRLAKIDVDKNQHIAAQFQVQSIPFVAALYQGQMVDEFMGLVPAPQLEAMIDRLLPPELAALASGGGAPAELPASEEELQAILVETPRDPLANLALAELHLERGQDAQAKARIDAVDPKKSDDHRDQIERLSALLVLRRLAAEAGEPDALRAAHQAAPADPQAAYRLGCALAGAGEYAEALALLLSAAERDKALLKSHVREAMVNCFYALGPRDPLSDKYRDELTNLLFA